MHRFTRASRLVKSWAPRATHREEERSTCNPIAVIVRHVRIKPRIGVRRNALRFSPYSCWVQPALRRPNFQLVTNALVHRNLFDGKRTTGIEYLRSSPGGTAVRK